MNITELLKRELPFKIKLNSNFKLEESFDPGTILLILKIEEDQGWESDKGERCYKISVKALKEDLKENRQVAISDWLNRLSKEFDSTYYDYHRPDSNGDYLDSIYVMEFDDCFNLIGNKEKFNQEENKKMWGEVISEAYKRAKEIGYIEDLSDLWENLEEALSELYYAPKKRSNDRN